MHVNAARLAVVLSACLACLAGGLLLGVATGGLRAEHVFRVETVTTTTRGAVLPAQTVTTTVPQVVTTSETVTATTRVIEVAVRHRSGATKHGSTGSRPAGPNHPPKQPKPAPKPAPAPAPKPKPPPPPKPKPPPPPKPKPPPPPPKPKPAPPPPPPPK